MNRETGKPARASHTAVCPFCRLLCDDLIVEQAGDRVRVAIPGLDHAAQLVRLDSVVSLYLERQRTSPLPSVAHLLTEIQNAL